MENQGASSCISLRLSSSFLAMAVTCVSSYCGEKKEVLDEVVAFTTSTGRCHPGQGQYIAELERGLAGRC